MRVNLKQDSMDIVMHIVRKHKLKLEDSFEFIVNNPEEIEITRGELHGDHNKNLKGIHKSTKLL